MTRWLAASLAGPAFGPVARAGQGFESAFANQAAIVPLLGVGDLVDAFGSGAGDPLRNDGVITQAKGFEKLLMDERDAFGSHRVAPCQPVVLLGIYERAIEIPEDGFSHAGDIRGCADFEARGISGSSGRR